MHAPRASGAKQWLIGLAVVATTLTAPYAMAAGPAPVNLRSTAHFTILSGAAVTTTGGGVITGDVGASPIAGSAILIPAPQVNGTIYAVDASGPAGSVIAPYLLTVAKSDLTAAYNEARDRTPVPSGTFLNPGSGNIGGLNLVPGLYKFTGTALITGSHVTLTGGPDDVWIFQIGADLQVGSGIHVILAGGAQARNIFWQVGTAAVLDTFSVFKGTILADQAITMKTSSTLEGRALAFTAGVTFNGTGGTLPRLEAGTVVNDFDGDGRTDLTVFDPIPAVWYMLKSSGDTNRVQQWGWNSTLPVPADYDADGTTDIAVFDPAASVWHIILSESNRTAALTWGFPGVIPVPADYDGDGLADLAVYQPTNGSWYVRQSTTGTMPRNSAMNWGFAGTIPAPADFDGDGKADLAVFHPASGNWYIRKSIDGRMLSGAPLNWGWSATLPVPADYDGDGKADLAVYHRDTGIWYIRESNRGQALGGDKGLQFGFSTAIPVPGDYDGDGKTDLAVFNPPSGQWYVRRSSDGLMQSGGPINWGFPSTLPIPPQFQVNRRFFATP